MPLGWRFVLVEYVDLTLDGDARVKYSYRLIDPVGRQRRAWDRDPVWHRGMPDHEHVDGAYDARVPMTVTLAQALRFSWQTFADVQREAAAGETSGQRASAER